MTDKPPVDADRLRFEAQDLDSAEYALEEMYACTQIEHLGDPSSVRISRGWLGRITLDTLMFRGALAYDAPTLGQICICRVHSGRIDTQARGSAPGTSEAGELIIFPTSQLGYSGQVHQAHLDLTLLDVSEFNGVAPAGPDSGLGAIQFAGHKPISPAAANRLSRFVDFLQKQMLTTPKAEQSPLLTAMAAQGLAATVLAALPNNGVFDPTYIDRRDSQQPALLRRAITFIEENAHTEVTLANIAAAVGVTPRAVQYMFRNNLDISPMEYLRRTRLRLAHQDLIRFDESTTTAGEIARKWGFANYTRFVARYKSEYNCSPQKTLHNS